MDLPNNVFEPFARGTLYLAGENALGDLFWRIVACHSIAESYRKTKAARKLELAKKQRESLAGMTQSHRKEKAPKVTPPTP